MNSLEVARIAHEVNRAYCAAIGDLAQVPWDEAPNWQRESAHEGVIAIMDGKVSSPGDSHRSWCEHKEADGWTWGPIKDPELKTHPCLVPYQELPASQQVKDYLFIHTVQTLLQTPLMLADSGAVLTITNNIPIAYSFGQRDHVEAMAAGLRGLAQEVEDFPENYDWVH